MGHISFHQCVGRGSCRRLVFQTLLDLVRSTRHEVYIHVRAPNHSGRSHYQTPLAPPTTHGRLPEEVTWWWWWCWTVLFAPPESGDQMCGCCTCSPLTPSSPSSPSSPCEMLRENRSVSSSLVYPNIPEDTTPARGFTSWLQHSPCSRAGLGSPVDTNTPSSASGGFQVTWHEMITDSISAWYLLSSESGASLEALGAARSGTTPLALRPTKKCCFAKRFQIYEPLQMTTSWLQCG